jgi:hypothetical protein
MVEKIGRLADDLGFALGDRGERQLDPFLAHLLRHAPRSLRDQLRRVAVRPRMGDALRHQLLERHQEGQ